MAGRPHSGSEGIGRDACCPGSGGWHWWPWASQPTLQLPADARLSLSTWQKEYGCGVGMVLLGPHPLLC